MFRDVCLSISFFCGLMFTSFSEARNAIPASASVSASELRIKAWRAFIDSADSYSSEQQLLQSVNRFINYNRYRPDSEGGALSENWHAPWEFMASGAGDCEEYAMTKLFTLQAMGLPADRMRLVYVLLKDSKQPHLVLMYKSPALPEPVILDNLKPQLLSAGLRTDLYPVFGFNLDRFWLMRDWQSSIASELKLALPGWQNIVTEWDANLQRYQP